MNERTIPYPPKNKVCHLSMSFIVRNKNFCSSTTNFTLISFAYLLFDFEMELHRVHKNIGMCINGKKFRVTDFLKTKKRSCASIFQAQNGTNVTNRIQIKGD